MNQANPKTDEPSDGRNSGFDSGRIIADDQELRTRVTRKIRSRRRWRKAIGDDGSEMPEAYDAAPQQPEEDDDDDVLDLAEVGEAVPPG